MPVRYCGDYWYSSGDGLPYATLSLVMTCQGIFPKRKRKRLDSIYRGNGDADFLEWFSVDSITSIEVFVARLNGTTGPEYQITLLSDPGYHCQASTSWGS
jgi:hypothetical protein